MIRDAQASDASAIAAIWNSVIKDSSITFTTKLKSEEDICALIRTGPMLVLEVDEDVAGFALFGPFRSGPGYRFVAEHSIYLASVQQRCGQGRTLLGALEDRARAAGIDTFVAGIGGENDAAQAFHTAMGYALVAKMPGVGEKFGRRHDLILMQKSLS